MTKQVYFLILASLLVSIRPDMAQGLASAASPTGDTRWAASLRQSEGADQVITGTVTDDKGEQLPGVSVTLKANDPTARQKGTTTDANGQYKLSVPDGAAVTLVFSYVGYLAQEKTIGGQTTINITLLADTRALDEVVVVGYGIQKKSDLTGSVVSIKRDRLEQLPNTNIAQALQGAIPGLQINTNAGGPSKATSPFWYGAVVPLVPTPRR